MDWLRDDGWWEIAMRTWPISRTTRDGWTYLGIPDRLGTGALWKSGDTFPTLEEVAGDDWSAAVLGVDGGAVWQSCSP